MLYVHIYMEFMNSLLRISITIVCNGGDNLVT